MAIILSLVGNQPSATAVAVKTWAKHKGNPDRILLLSTPQVKGQAERLKSYFGRIFGPGLTCDILSVVRELGTRDSVPEVVRAELSDLGGHDPIAFCADPGLKYMSVALAQTLRDAVFLHSDTENLHWGVPGKAGDTWESVSLEDLGMDTLMSLYGLEFQSSGMIPDDLRTLISKHAISIPDHVHKGFRFELAGGSLPSLDLAYERKGWFFGLKTITRDRPGHKEQVRELARMASELRHLRPVLAILSYKPTTRARASSMGMQAIAREDRDGLYSWVNGRAHAPGHETIRAVTEGVTTPAPTKGRGGSGPPLIVWMGTDPSATLVALCTHQPRKAWVLYDATTPGAVELSHRLAAQACALPVGEMIFMASDLLGRGACLKVRKQIRVNRSGPVRFNITPGTKLQACVLAAALDPHTVELWSIRQDKDCESARPLTGDESLRLSGPSIVTQASICGGCLQSEGEAPSTDWDPKFRDFLTALGRFLDAYMKENSLSALPRKLDGASCSRGRLVVRGYDVTLEFEGRTRKSKLSLSGGRWFEKVVAICFVQAGAEEVRVNLKWAWPKGTRVITPGGVEDTWRDEVDVIARFGHRFVAVSCTIDNEAANAKARAVAPVADRGLGRFAIPVVVLPRVAPARVRESLDAKQGAVFLDLGIVADPLELRNNLRTIWSQRRTLDT